MLSRFFFCCLFLSSIGLSASEGPRIIHFDKRAYEGENQNWSIAQHQNGYMYFGNGAGVLEYDGIRWTQYPLPSKQIVRAISTDQQGRIFSGGFGSFGFWAPDTFGMLTYHALSDRLAPEVIKSEEIWKIVHLNDQTYFQSFSQLYVYKNDSLRHITPPGNIMLMHVENGQLYIPVIHEGIYIFDATEQFQLLEGTEDLLDFRVAAVYQMGHDSLLIGTQKNGLFWYVDRKITPIKSELSNELRLNQLNRALRLSNGSFAFGTISNGIILTSPELDPISRLNTTNGLQNNTILSMYEDPVGQLWVGMDKGIDLVQVQLPTRFYHDESGQIGTVYTAEKYQDKLYLGTNQGVYVRSLVESGAEEFFELLPGSQGQVWELEVFNGVLLCGHNNGTFRIEDHSFHKISDQTGGWHTIHIPGDSTHLIQGTYNGLVIYQWTSNQTWAFEKRVKGYVGPLREIYSTGDHEFWGVTPFEGVFRFTLSSDYSSIIDLSNYGVNQGIHIDSRMDMFPAAPDLYFYSDGRYYTYNEGLDSMLMQSHITLGNHHKIEVGKLDYHSENDFFVVENDLVNWHLNGEIYQIRVPLVQHFEQIEKIDERTYLFCLDNGYATISMDEIQAAQSEQNEVAPGIARVEVHDFQNFYPVRLHSAPLSLKAHHNHLTFYVNHPMGFKEVWPEYRLIGFNDAWSPVPQSGQKEFTNLSPGAYDFVVRQNAYSESVNIYSFEILPKWYLTRWAFGVYILSIVALIFLFLKLHQNRLEDQRRKMQLEKERELYQQRVQSKNEQLELDVINKSRQLADSTMGLIRKNEILMQVKEELINGKKDQRNDQKFNYQKISRIIDQHITSQHDWEVFEENFTQVHEAFFKKLKEDYTDLTPGDLKLAAYLKMNLSSKEIAPLLNISIRGVENKRYRLRSKMKLAAEENLTEVMMRY